MNDELEERISEITVELIETEEKLKKFMESATDGFALIDSKLNYIDANKVTLQTVGKTKEELIGKNMLDIVSNLKETGRYDKYLEVLKTGEPFSTEDVIINRLDGSLNSYLSIRAFKVGDDLGIIFTDITESKKAENKIKELSKMKSEFLRRASHELKTPLISIKGFSELILSLYADQLDTPIISKLEEINDGCDRLQNIINNLLKTSKLESPDLKPKLQKEDLSFLVKFCMHELEALAEKRNQMIKVDIQSDLYANIEKEEIHDVLSNLLTNAIKYTPPLGKIEIKTEIKKNFLVISVKDNGIGFTNEQKKIIFQQFGKIERYGQGLDLGIDGTGLGLYISKRIVESHGGKIWMESEGKSRGSTFYFTLPFVRS